MITSDNFCHIEQAADGVKVLFWVEYDGDAAILHQIATLEIGTFDLSVTLPSDRMEEFWPHSIQFAVAAEKVVATAKELGFSTRHETSTPSTSDNSTDIEGNQP